MSTPNLPDLTGQAYEYEVGDYHLHIVFEGENRLHWTYLKAPEGETGKSAVEHLDVMVPIRDNVLLMEWKEETDIQVIDILDLGQMNMYSTHVTPEGERSFTQCKVRRAE